MADADQPSQPPRYEDIAGQGAGDPDIREPEAGDPAVRASDVTPTHQSMARTTPPRRTGPVIAAVAITLVLGLVGAWLWAAMGPALGVTVFAVGVVLLLVMMTALRGKRGAASEVESPP